MNGSALEPPDDDDRPPKGRPTKLTDDVFRTFVELLLNGQYRQDVCHTVGISYKTFRSWMNSGKKYPDGIYGQFRKAVMAAESRCKQKLVEQILAAAKDDPKYACWYLERKYPEQFGQYRGEIGEMRRRIREMERLVDATATSTAEDS